MSRAAPLKSRVWTFVVTTQCMAMLTACGNGLSFGHGSYSRKSALDTSRSSGSSDATWTQAMLQEEKQFCERTGHRPARFIFALAHALDKSKLTEAAIPGSATAAGSQDDLVAKSAFTELETELTALQKSLDHIQRINNAAKSAAPKWPGIEFQFKPFRLLRSASDDLASPVDFEYANPLLRKNLNETSTAPMVDTFLETLILSIESIQSNYTEALQSSALGNTNNSELSRPLSEANTIMMVLVARSTSEPDPEELENAKRLFGAERFSVVTVESAQNPAAPLDSRSPAIDLHLSKIVDGALACGSTY